MTILQSSAQDLFVGATITANVAPLNSTYDVTLLGAMLPMWRIRWGVGTVTITWTLAAPVRGDVFAWPMSNVTTGHATLTNGAALSQALTMAALSANGIPKTTVVDLSVGTPLDADRTSNVWHLVISGNLVNVVLGAAISLYGPKTSFSANGGFLLGVNRRKKAGTSKGGNPDYMSDFRLSLQTEQRFYDVSAICNPTDGDMLESFFDGCIGNGLPGLLWMDTSVNDALYGFYGDEFSRKQNDSRTLDLLTTTFTELSKGVKLL